MISMQIFRSLRLLKKMNSRDKHSINDFSMLLYMIFVLNKNNLNIPEAADRNFTNSKKIQIQIHWILPPKLITTKLLLHHPEPCLVWTIPGSSNLLAIDKFSIC